MNRWMNGLIVELINGLGRQTGWIDWLDGYMDGMYVFMYVSWMDWPRKM